MVSRQIHENLPRRLIKMNCSRGLATGLPAVVRLTGLRRSGLGTSWRVVLEGLPLVSAQTKVGQGLGDGVDVNRRGKKDHIIVHSRAEEI
jgi:hypothetical protein